MEPTLYSAIVVATVLHEMCRSKQVMEPSSNCSSCSVTLLEREAEIFGAPPVESTVGSGSGAHCGCGPQDLQWDNNGIWGPTGQWDASCNCSLGSLQGCRACDNYHCQFGPTPESGMGSVYSDARRTPTGVLLSLLRSSQGSQRLKMVSTKVTHLQSKGVYALAWKSQRREHEALLLLSNPWPNKVVDLPSVQELLPRALRVIGALRLAQTNGTNDVSALDGLQSTVSLLGKVLPAPRFKGPVNQKMRLGPYEVVKLWIVFEGCCSHKYYAE